MKPPIPGISVRLRILGQIYAIYEDFLADRNVACHKGCSLCCTRNVVLTSLEGYYIYSAMDADTLAGWVDHLEHESHHQRFQPVITTNQLAAMSLKGQDPPQERMDTSGDPCPFLTNQQCPIYTLRPFGCRCLVSNHACADKGFAEIDPLVISANTVILQYIEHLDRPGCTGNLLDIVLVMNESVWRYDYLAGRPTPRDRHRLIVNQPMPALMIPPEHRKALGPLIHALQKLH